MQDVIVIGGTYAGMAAALQLARARRNVVDAGQRRNCFASHSYGFLGQDGVEPGVIHAGAKRQLLVYPTVRWIEGTAIGITGQKGDSRVDTDGAETVAGRRILLATGVIGRLPDIPGLAERWGRTVFHCPYCHGHELDRGRIGVIVTELMSIHQAQLLLEWGAVTLLTNGTLSLDPVQRDELDARGVAIEETPITQLTGVADVQLHDGRVLSFAGLFTAGRTEPASPLIEAAACALTETLMGLRIATSDSKENDVPGIFACGDVARLPHSVSLAVGAGAQLHRSLLWLGGLR